MINDEKREGYFMINDIKEPRCCQENPLKTVRPGGTESVDTDYTGMYTLYKTTPGPEILAHTRNPCPRKQHVGTCGFDYHTQLQPH
jgi:hypothetical protein